MKKTVSAVCAFLIIFTSIFVLSSDSVAESATHGAFSIDKNSPRVFLKDGESVTLYPASVISDISGDGLVTASDARGILRISSKLDNFSGDISFIDINGDSLITALDARLALLYSAGLNMYYKDADFSISAGFLKDNGGDCYYVNDYGLIATGKTVIDGSGYIFDSSGRMEKGFTRYWGDTYYLDENGKMTTGLVAISGDDYFFDNEGRMKTGRITLDGKTYYFTKDGKKSHEVKPSGAGDESIAKAKNIVKNTPLYNKICQMIFITPEKLSGAGKVTVCDNKLKDALEKYPVGGVVLFAQNLENTDQTKKLISDMQEAVFEKYGVKMFLGVDEEGGSVARCAKKLDTVKFYDMSVYGETGDVKKAYDIGAALSNVLKNLGFNVDFAPVADTITNAQNEVVKKRSFGSDPNVVASMVENEIKGFIDGGVISSAKHFPNHGSTAGDTHFGFVTSDAALEELEKTDLLPFKAAIDAGVPMIMTGHMTFTNIDKDAPASLSEKIVTGILREKLNYDGVVLTDSLGMRAISNLYTPGEAAVAAIEAGNDMLLGVTDIEKTVNALTEAVKNGKITEERIDESVTRIIAVKIEYGIIS